VALEDRPTDRSIRLELTGGMMAYDWGFNGKPFDHKRITPVQHGERVKLEFVNTTTMFHAVHLHEHTFAVDGPAGPRKDTAIVLPGQRMGTLFDADNWGLWMVHCHNVRRADRPVTVHHQS
jgi:multicopper oxidase